VAKSSAERRAESAAATVEAIVEAARELFLADGYFATRVEQIAQRADVSPATVYAVTGGKAGLIERLVSQWADSPRLPSDFTDLHAERDPAAVIRELARRTRQVREEHGDTMRILLRTASNEPALAKALEASTSRYRSTLHTIAEHLVDVGLSTSDVAYVTDVLWFYFGYSGFFALLDDNGWDLDRSEQWLYQRCQEALGIGGPAPG
jgi:AcrR family transcriptional regulator